MNENKNSVKGTCKKTFKSGTNVKTESERLPTTVNRYNKVTHHWNNPNSFPDFLTFLKEILKTNYEEIKPRKILQSI